MGFGNDTRWERELEEWYREQEEEEKEKQSKKLQNMKNNFYKNQKGAVWQKFLKPYKKG